MTTRNQPASSPQGRFNDPTEFYEGTGFAHLTGPEADKARDYDARIKAIREEVNLTGNLFEPVAVAEFPGCPTPIPINWLGIGDRRLEYCTVIVKPGQGFPFHKHAYADEVYLVVRGQGVVRIGERTYNAKLHDCFHMVAGVNHTLENPAESTEDFCVFIVNAPAIPLETRPTHWAIPQASQSNDK